MLDIDDEVQQSPPKRGSSSYGFDADEAASTGTKIGMAAKAGSGSASFLRPEDDGVRRRPSSLLLANSADRSSKVGFADVVPLGVWAKDFKGRILQE